MHPNTADGLGFLTGGCNPDPLEDSRKPADNGEVQPMLKCGFEIEISRTSTDARYDAATEVPGQQTRDWREDGESKLASCRS